MESHLKLQLHFTKPKLLCSMNMMNNAGSFLPFIVRPIPFIVCPIPFIVRPIPFIVRPISFIFRPIPFIVRPIPLIVRPIPFIVRPIPFNVRPIPFIVRPIPFIVRPIPFSRTFYAGHYLPLLSGPSFKEGQVRFATVHLKPLILYLKICCILIIFSRLFYMKNV